MKTVFLFAPGENVPFLAMRCDDVRTVDNELLLIKDNEVVAVSEYAFYEVHDCESDKEEEQTCRLMEQFRTELTTGGNNHA